MQRNSGCNNPEGSADNANSSNSLARTYWSSAHSFHECRHAKVSKISVAQSNMVIVNN